MNRVHVTLVAPKLHFCWRIDVSNGNSRRLDDKINVRVKKFMAMSVVDQCRIMHDIMRSNYFLENELDRLTATMARSRITSNRSKLDQEF